MRGLESLYGVRVFILAITASLGWAAPGHSSELGEQADRILPQLIATYRQLHAAPELSYQEKETAGVLATQLRRLGYEVHTGIGRYARPGLTGYGVVGLLRQGVGPTVLVRTEMDALPVTEATGLPYASKVKVRTGAGEMVGVAHACGHDIHMASFLGVAQLLVQLKDRWRGAVLLIAQPAEEMGEGAAAMLADRLYERFGRPDFVLALHDDPQVPAGSVGYVPGFAMSAMSSLDILVRGVGSHGSRPEAGKDPIVLAAQIITALQTIVSREISPLDQAVVTVGTIHGGTKRNIIPEEVSLALTVRTYKEEVQRQVLASIERIAHFTALAAGVPKDRLPQVVIRTEEVLPATYNDPKLTARIATAFEAELGSSLVKEVAPAMVSEDFSRFSLQGQIPSLIFRLGATDPILLTQAESKKGEIPGLHSPGFVPAAELAISTGVRAMTAAVLELLDSERR